MRQQQTHTFLRLSEEVRHQIRIGEIPLGEFLTPLSPHRRKRRRRAPLFTRRADGLLQFSSTALFYQPVLPNPRQSPTSNPGVQPRADVVARRPDPSAFLERLRAFDAFGRTTDAFSVEGIPYLMNAFWTQHQRAAHPLHEVPFRASFRPALPQFFIEGLTRVGDTVHDPFMGRGTVPLAAALSGRIASGSDINPLSAMLLRPRLRQVTLPAIAEVLHRIDWTAGCITRPELLAYFHPETLRELEALRSWLSEHAPQHALEPAVEADWIRMAALTRLTGHSPGYMSVRTLPPNQTTTLASQIRMNERTGQTPARRHVRPIILAKARALLKQGSLDQDAPMQLGIGPAWQTPWVRTASVDLVMCSPPFADVVDYGREAWMRAWFAGIDADAIAFSHHAKLTDWQAMIRKVLLEAERIVRPGGCVALEVGEIRRGTVLLEQLVWEAAAGLAFERLAVVVHDQVFTKSAHCYGVRNATAGTNTNRIVLLQRRFSA